MMPGELWIYPTTAELVDAAAIFIFSEATGRIGTTGRFSVLLAGGNTPKAVYARLAHPENREQLDWSRLDFFWGDERCVPSTHPDSNYQMAVETLFADKPVQSLHTHRIQVELGALQAAEQYEKEILDYFGVHGAGVPVFDLVLLGLGEDGHTASIFPGTFAVGEQHKWVMAVPHNQPPLPLVDRVTVTFRLINSARRVLFLVTGASKAQVLQQVLAKPSTNGPMLPVQRVQPDDGSVTWMVDRAAAGLLSPGQDFSGNFSIG